MEWSELKGKELKEGVRKEGRRRSNSFIKTRTQPEKVLDKHKCDFPFSDISNAFSQRPPQVDHSVVPNIFEVA